MGQEVDEFAGVPPEIREKIKDGLSELQERTAVATANLVIGLQRDFVLNRVRAELGDAVHGQVARAFDAYLEHEQRGGDEFAKQESEPDN